VNSLLGNNLPTLHWADTQRWRYAHPNGEAKIEDTASASEIGLYFAGDAFVGKGRVPGALQTGLAAANRMLAHS
jgi:predicted NAD/FAD-dependent oxidoreductase